MFTKGLFLTQLEAILLLAAFAGIALLIAPLVVVLLRQFRELDEAASRVAAAEAKAEMERARADKFGWRCVESMKDARRERAVKEAALAELEAIPVRHRFAFNRDPVERVH